MAETLNHENISDTIEKSWEITPNDLNNAKSIISKSPEELANELWDNYELNCWVEEEKCRDIWVGSIINKWNEMWIENLSVMEDVIRDIHKWKDITELTDPQKEIAKEMITATAKQKWETFEGAVNKSAWSSQDTDDDKFNHALNTAILILNTDAKKM
jgi:hypothetical protein